MTGVQTCALPISLPGNFELLANYGYNQLRSEVNSSLDYMPRHIASIWSTKTFGLADEAQLRLGAGIVYSGKSKSTGPLDPYGINPAIPASALYTVVTPSRTTVDALAEINWNSWRFALRSEEHTSELQSLMRISYAV